VAFIAYNSADVVFPNLYSRSPFLEMGSQWVFMGFVVSLVWSQVHRYRRVSSPAQRLQTRWVVFGTTLAIAGSFPTRLPLDFSWVGGDSPFVLLVLEAGFTLSFLLVPFSIGAAMVRSHLFDVDVLINRTLVYGSLSATLVALYFGAIVVLQRLFVVLTGQRSTLAVVASTLLIAALFTPFRSRIQSFIDRRFYRRKYDAAKTLEAFSSKLRNETDLGSLSGDLIAVITETMHPEHVSLWLRPDATSDGQRTD